MLASEADIQQSLHGALQANKDHQYALRIYSERIDAELESLNKLLAAADVSDTEEDTLEVNSGGWVVIPNAVDALAPLPSSELLSEASPFRSAALRRQQHANATVIHQWKLQELEALSDAVKSENHRLYAVEAQLRGQQGLARPTEEAAKFMEENIAGIDWERVSVKVSKSNLSGDHRTAKECEIKWLGERHPRFDHSQWTQSEIDRVKQLVANCVPGQINWVDVAERLGTRRTLVDCMRHAIFRKLHAWDSVSDQRLRDAVEAYGTDNWILVARLISEDATPQQCQSRWTRHIDPNIKHSPFTEEEDKLLRDATAVFGNAWQDIAQFIPGRTNEQCRERAQELHNTANPKRKWTDIEDRTLLDTVDPDKPVDWKEVSKVLGTGRTDSQCRNRYNVLMRRVTRSALPSATGNLRPILPAPTPAPGPSLSVGPSISQPGSRASSRPPGQLRPILPAPGHGPATSPTAGPSQPHAPSPPKAGSTAESSAYLSRLVSPMPIRPLAISDRPASSSEVSSAPPKLGPLVRPRKTAETNSQEPLASCSPAVAEVQAAPSGGNSAASPAEAPPPPRPRPRPRRKQAAEPGPAPTEPSTSSAPLVGNPQQNIPQSFTPTMVDKGKARETAQEPAVEGNASARSRRPTKRAHDAVADSPPSKKRQAKKKASDAAPIALVIGASDEAAQTANAPATAANEDQVTSSQPTPSGGKRGRRPGTRAQTSRQQPTRRSTRTQRSAANSAAETTTPSGQANASPAANAGLEDDLSELSSPPASP